MREVKANPKSLTKQTLMLVLKKQQLASRDRLAAGWALLALRLTLAALDARLAEPVQAVGGHRVPHDAKADGTADVETKHMLWNRQHGTVVLSRPLGKMDEFSLLPSDHS